MSRSGAACLKACWWMGGQQPPANSFGQADPWGQYQGGHSGYPGQPPRKKTGLIIGIVLAAVLLVGGGVTAAVLLNSKSDKSNPESLQAAVVDAYNSRDVQQFQPLMCGTITPSTLKTLQDMMDQLPAGVVYSAGDPPEINGNTGTLHLNVEGNGRKADFPLPIAKPDGAWCVNG